MCSAIPKGRPARVVPHSHFFNVFFRVLTYLPPWLIVLLLPDVFLHLFAVDTFLSQQPTIIASGKKHKRFEDFFFSFCVMFTRNQFTGDYPHKNHSLGATKIIMLLAYQNIIVWITKGYAHLLFVIFYSFFCTNTLLN